LREYSEDDVVREAAEAREKARREQASALKKAINEGIEIGEAKGKAEGKAEGIYMVAKSMKESGMAFADIAKMAGISVEVVEML
jgi:predicted transposase/invertase (TIGR01784 family)